MIASMPDADLNKRLERAREIADGAGRLAQQLRSKGLRVEAKGRQDFVTDADRQVEAYIAEKLRACYPSDGFFGEEGGLIGGRDGHWVVDPIDGTSNFMNGLDHWSVSIAYVVSNLPVLGCVFAPDRNELFAAAQGHGSRLDEAVLQVQEPDSASLMFGLGISDRVPFSQYSGLLDRLNGNCVEHRRFGSAALSIADVAAGRLDGYFEHHVNIWDVAAALVIAREAGAEAAGFDDPASFENGDYIFVAAPGLRNIVDWGIRPGANNE